MKYGERSHRRSLRYPKSKAGTMSNRHRTVIMVFARYLDEALSHNEQERRGLSWKVEKTPDNLSGVNFLYISKE